jgi:spore coat protein A, manganese oxidase
MKPLSRRDTLKLGLMGGSSLFLTMAMQRTNPVQSSPQLKAFALPLNIPPVLQPSRSDATTDYYEVTMQKAVTEIIPGVQTEIWGYNGITPGPTIRQRGGATKRRSIVRFINDLGNDPEGEPIHTVVHLHGLASAPQYDGYTTDMIPPAHFKDYVYTNDHDAGTFWYHDHLMDKTARSIEAGLTGFYILEDELEQGLSLPKGEYDIPLVIQTKRFTTDGQIFPSNQRPENLFGDVMLINGVPLPRMEVANRKYRFRILNAAATRHYVLALSQKADILTPGEKLVVIGSDAGLLSAPVELVTPEQGLPVAIAERYDVIIDFSQYPVGSQVYLQYVIQDSDFSGNIRPNAKLFPCLRFDVSRTAVDDSQIPAQLRPIDPLPITADTPQRRFSFARGENGRWTINGKMWDVDRIDANPQPGAIEVWTFTNPNQGTFHPVHLHVADAQLIDRNGQPPRPFERGWKDVFLLGSQETIRVAVRFKDGVAAEVQGKFMMHCHQLVHEDRGMMSQFQVGAGGVDPTTTAPAQPYHEQL